MSNTYVLHLDDKTIKLIRSWALDNGIEISLIDCNTLLHDFIEYYTNLYYLNTKVSSRQKK